MEWSEKQEVPVRSKLKKSHLFPLKIAFYGSAEYRCCNAIHPLEEIGTNPLKKRVFPFPFNDLGIGKSQRLREMTCRVQGSIIMIKGNENAMNMTRVFQS